MGPQNNIVLHKPPPPSKTFFRRAAIVPLEPLRDFIVSPTPSQRKRSSGALSEPMKPLTTLLCNHHTQLPPDSPGSSHSLLPSPSDPLPRYYCSVSEPVTVAAAETATSLQQLPTNCCRHPPPVPPSHPTKGTPRDRDNFTRCQEPSLFFMFTGRASPPSQTRPHISFSSTGGATPETFRASHGGGDELQTALTLDK
ncbi:unnamed protein product [Pleuronectes platessa]|uniref:Uncharacterized protein n=1 Tax=Pleuronectes platessa TaxID=8262 RepID=A0A9N7TQ83_PLEPL|nr:unnamed protein product [Pleuronectes platessa]